MKLLMVETDRSLNNYLMQKNFFCEYCLAKQISENLLDKKEIYPIAVVNLDKVTNSDLRLLKKDCSIVGVYSYEVSQDDLNLCDYSFRFDTPNRQILTAIDSLMQKERFIPIETIPGLAVNQDVPVVVYNKQSIRLSRVYWLILLLFAHSPQKNYTMEQIKYHSFPVGEEPANGSLNVQVCKLRRVLRTFVGREVIHCNGHGIFSLTPLETTKSYFFNSYSKIQVPIEKLEFLRPAFQRLYKLVKDAAISELKALSTDPETNSRIPLRYQKYQRKSFLKISIKNNTFSFENFRYHLKIIEATNND